jgi:hypothetical protein
MACPKNSPKIQIMGFCSFAGVQGGKKRKKHQN